MRRSFPAEHATQPQWKTSSRLLRLGEAIEFRLYLPEHTESESLTIFPRYLEQAQPGHGFDPEGGLAWLDGLPSESIDLGFIDGWACARYSPDQPGSYLARWRVGGESLYRYFSAIEDNWVVVGFSTFLALESQPTLHGTGIPLDYRLPAAQFRYDDGLLQKLLDYQRRYGDNLIPSLPDMPAAQTTTREERIELYGLLLANPRAVLPFPEDVRSARVEMHHQADPGYTKALAQVGINDHCGLCEANAKPWLGMPEFPYFSSDGDCRKPRQSDGGSVVAHQWDFCGGYHFLGPVSWHYKVAQGDWSLAERCLRDGFEELADLTVFSGHPAFALPLYDGVVDIDYPNPRFNCVLDGPDGDHELSMSRFVEQYQRFMAFEAPKQYKVVYARSVDIADYYQRHFAATPRTVFVSRTDHVTYDMWWLCHWCEDRMLVPRQIIPAETRISTLMAYRREHRYYKDPLSHEYILVEDRRRSIRFERECANPIWWFDYTQEEQGPEGGVISHTETPDVEVLPSEWSRTARGLELHLKLVTEATFPEYAIVLWNVPPELGDASSLIDTDATECIEVWNRAGEYHLVLFFDLRPGLELTVSVATASPPEQGSLPKPALS